MIREPARKLVEHVMPGRGLDAFMAERFLRQADIPPGQLGADEAPKVMRFDMRQANVLGVALHGAPGRRQMHGARRGAVALAGEAGKDVRALHRAPRQPGLDAGVGFVAQGGGAPLGLLLPQDRQEKTAVPTEQAAPLLGLPPRRRGSRWWPGCGVRPDRASRGPS